MHWLTSDRQQEGTRHDPRGLRRKYGALKPLKVGMSPKDRDRFEELGELMDKLEAARTVRRTRGHKTTLAERSSSLPAASLWTPDNVYLTTLINRWRMVVIGSELQGHAPTNWR